MHRIEIYDHSIYCHATKFESNLGSDKRGHAAAQPDVRSARVKAFKKRGGKSLLPPSLPPSFLPSFRLACFYCISSHLHPVPRRIVRNAKERERAQIEEGVGTEREGGASTTSATSDDIRRSSRLLSRLISSSLPLRNRLLFRHSLGGA